MGVCSMSKISRKELKKENKKLFKIISKLEDDIQQLREDYNQGMYKWYESRIKSLETMLKMDVSESYMTLMLQNSQLVEQNKKYAVQFNGLLKVTKEKLEANTQFQHFKDEVGISWNDFEIIDTYTQTVLKQGSKAIGDFKIYVDGDKTQVKYDLTV